MGSEMYHHTKMDRNYPGYELCGFCEFVFSFGSRLSINTSSRKTVLVILWKLTTEISPVQECQWKKSYEIASSSGKCSTEMFFFECLNHAFPLTNKVYQNDVCKISGKSFFVG